MKIGYRPEGALADPVLFAMAVPAKGQSEFIVRLLAHAAVLVVRSRLHSDMGCFAWLVPTTQTWERSYHRQIDRVVVDYLFQLHALRYAEGAFEQGTGLGWRG